MPDVPLYDPRSEWVYDESLAYVWDRYKTTQRHNHEHNLINRETNTEMLAEGGMHQNYALYANRIRNAALSELRCTQFGRNYSTSGHK